MGKTSSENMSNNNLPILIKKGSLGNSGGILQLPFKDLWVSPGHRIIKNKKFIHASDLKEKCNIYPKKMVNYYHLECEEHYIINSNGIMSETMINYNSKCRDKFEKVF